MNSALKDSRGVRRSKRQRKKLLKQAHLWMDGWDINDYQTRLMRPCAMSKESINNELIAKGYMPVGYCILTPKHP